jgi:hypothetical protein
MENYCPENLIRFVQQGEIADRVYGKLQVYMIKPEDTNIYIKICFSGTNVE